MQHRELSQEEFETLLEEIFILLLANSGIWFMLSLVKLWFYRIISCSGLLKTAETIGETMVTIAETSMQIILFCFFKLLNYFFFFLQSHDKMCIKYSLKYSLY